MSRLDEIRQRLEKATPGPWVATTWINTSGGWAAVGPLHDTEDDPDDASCFYDGCEPNCQHDKAAQADAALIANAPADLAYLLWRLELAEAVFQVLTETDNPSAPADLAYLLKRLKLAEAVCQVLTETDNPCAYLKQLAEWERAALKGETHD